MNGQIQNTPPNMLTMESLRQQIEDRAYQLYLDRGKIDGFQEQDWLQAEDEVVDSIVQFAPKMQTPSNAPLKAKVQKA
jgi:hypothetical protein